MLPMEPSTNLSSLLLEVGVVNYCRIAEIEVNVILSESSAVAVVAHTDVVLKLT